jgi:glycosyltransferase involved in cell wall biosynthesis
MGRPIIVNDVDETADFVRKHSCGFVSQPSPEAMAEAMAKAAMAPAQQLAEMGARARQMAESNFSWDAIGQQYAQVVQEVTSSFYGIGAHTKRGKQ